MTGFTAHLEWIPDEQLALDQIEDRLYTGDTRGIAAAIGTDRISATFVAHGENLLEALADAIAHATGAVPGAVVAAELLTFDEHDRRLTVPT